MSQPEQKEVAEITVTRNTRAGGKFRASGDLLKIGSDIDKNEARQLLRSGKALPGNQTRAGGKSGKKSDA